MKKINGCILALIISLSVQAVETNSPAPATNVVAPAAPVAPPTNPAPEIVPVPKPETTAKPAVKKTKKAKAKTPKTLAKPSAQKSEAHIAINPPETGIVRQNAVNVRGQPNFVGEVITKLKKGESVTLLEEINLAKTKQDEPAQWYRIAMPSNTPVWVNTSFIDPTSKTILPKKLKVRAGPGENFSMVGILEKGIAVKEIRTVNGWSEIETPAGTYAFVAADLIERASSAPVVPPPTAPEVVAVPPTETAVVPAAPENPAPVAPAPTENVAPVVTPAPAPPVEEPLPKRIVTREGIVRRSLNLQTPSYFALESPDTGKIINYLYNPQPGFTLKPWVGTKVVVTGEESLDKRWPNTPVIEIETIDQR